MKAAGVPKVLSHYRGSCQKLSPSWVQNPGCLAPKEWMWERKGNRINGT